MPFTADEFLALIETYNRTLWPAPIVAYVAGIVAVAAAFRQTRSSPRIVGAVLGLMWLWTAIGYHGLTFSTLHRPALGFAGAFALQAILILVYVAARRDVTFRWKADAYGMIGGLFVLLALVGYPLLSSLMGHPYPRTAMFGIAPTPVVIFTLGLLLWADRPVPRFLLMIPFLWSFLGFVQSLSLELYEDVALIVAGVAGSLMVIRHDQVLTKTKLRAVSFAGGRK